MTFTSVTFTVVMIVAVRGKLFSPSFTVRDSARWAVTVNPSRHSQSHVNNKKIYRGVTILSRIIISVEQVLSFDIETFLVAASSTRDMICIEELAAKGKNTMISCRRF